MSNTAKFIKEIVIQDPTTGGDVHVGIYQHQNGGIFGIDSSFIEQEREDTSDAIYDPFAQMGEPEELYLEEDTTSYLDKVEALLRQGKKLMAIKAYKDATGMGLRDSKLVVEGIQQKINIENHA
jgi:hypothetical protein